jgi:hypothetical protein
VQAVNPSFVLNSQVATVTATANLNGQAVDRNTNAVADGRVFLLRITAQGAYDTLRFNGNNFVSLQANGLFSMPNVVLGDYILIVRPNPTVYPNLLPTYWPNTIDWQAAGVVQVRTEAQNLTVTVDGRPSGNLPTGNATVSGRLEEDVDGDERMLNRRSIEGAGVSIRVASGSIRESFERNLLQQDFVLIGYMLTGADGLFRFTSLPQGRYRLQIDLPGVPMNEGTEVAFDLRGIAGEEIELSAVVVDGQINVTRVRYLAGAEAIAAGNLTVYPNPAVSTVQVQLEHSQYLSAKVQITDIQGRLLMERSLSSNEIASGKLALDVSSLRSGAYIVHFIGQSDRALELRSAKLIKK